MQVAGFQRADALRDQAVEATNLLSQIDVHWLTVVR
jgi:hypothetical protein